MFMNTRNNDAASLHRGPLALLACTAGCVLLLTAGCGNKADDTATTPPTGASVAAPAGAPGAPGVAAPGNMNGSSASDAAKRKAAMEAAGAK